MMALHAPAGHASLRHAIVTPRIRIRSTLTQARKLDPSRQLADRIVAFAAQAEGREVGDGECYALAEQALTRAGAHSAADYTQITPDGDYVWGRPVPLDRVRPGDILQFRNFRILRRVTTTSAGEDGVSNTMQSQELEERDHHTAIVTQNLGNMLVIAEQNVEPMGRVVQRDTIEIAAGITTSRTAGGLTQTTTQVRLDGDIRAYRPQLGAPTALAEAGPPSGS